MKKLLLLLTLCTVYTITNAQERQISGILADHGESLIGANVSVFRNDILIHGTITDIEGKYTIKCDVGDKIEFSYTGFTTRSIIVTESMLSNYKYKQQKASEKIHSQAFKDKMDERREKILGAIKQKSDKGIEVAKLAYPHALNSWFVDFEFKKGQVKLIRQKKPISYSLSITQKLGVQMVSPFHTHQLQNIYSQGRSLNGVLTYQDRTNGESFSFGPKITSSPSSNIQVQDNNLLKSGYIASTKINFQAEQNNKKVYGILNFERAPDIFDTYSNNLTNLKIGLIEFDKGYSLDHSWHAEINVNHIRLGNHNYTGYYQNALKSMMVQSPSFDAQNGIEENASFSPEFDHPSWILNNNSNPVQSDVTNLFIQHNWKSSDRSNKLSNAISVEYKTMKIVEKFKGSSEQLSNQLNVKTPSAKLISKLEYSLCKDVGLKLKVGNIITASKADFLSKRNQVEDYRYSDQLLRNTSTARLEFHKNKLKYAVGINSLLSNNQTNDLLSPNFALSYKWKFRRKKIDELQPYISAERLVKNLDLLLDRYNYSSLQIDHNRLQDLRLDLPLWLPDNLNNEIKKEYKVGLRANKQYSKAWFTSRLEYKYIDQQNVIFPTLENDQWILQNAADFSTHHISWLSQAHGEKEILYINVHFTNTFEISHFRTKVNKLYGSSDNIPIAGYADISKNLIVGQPVGVIVGSDFTRNELGDMIIAEDGFPTKSDQRHIIADPTPLFTFAFSQKIRIDDYSLNIVVDGQVGGKVWDGTQQTLDYFGVSQNSADNREIDDFVFEGVKNDGSVNDIEVAFADPQIGLEGNRWTRYGVSGISSDYIRNASHINLRLIEFAYEKNTHNGDQLKLALYAKNLLTIASFQGFSTSNLYEDSIAYGLQYFNQPITTEIGMSLTYKL